MGLISQSVGRALSLSNTRVISPARERQMAAVVAYNQRRTMTKSSPELYRNWSIHAPLVRTAMDIRLGQLALADWDIMPFDRDAKKPDPGLVRRQRELFQMPNPSGESFGSFAWAVGDDILALDAGAIEKERMLKGEIYALWPVDGAKIAVDRFWDGDPRAPRYYWVPQPNVERPLLNSDLVYLMIHKRTYQPVGISYLEILRQTIESELSGSLFNARQIAQAAPDGIMDLGENARPEQVTAFKSFFQSELAGKGSIGFWGGTKGSKFIPFRGSNKEAQFIEFLTWEARKIAIVFQLSPQDLGLLHDVNRANAEVQQQNTEDRGARTFLANFEDYMTSEVCWDPAWGGRRNNTCLRFRETSDRTSKVKAEEMKIALAGMPYESINGARISLGLQPIGDPNDQNNPFNKLMANTPLGLATIDLVPNAKDLVRNKQPDPDDGGEAKPAPKAAEKMYEVVTMEQVSELVEKSLSAKPEPESPTTVVRALVTQLEETERLSDERLMELWEKSDQRLEKALESVRETVAAANDRPIEVRVDNPVHIDKDAISIAEGAVQVTVEPTPVVVQPAPVTVQQAPERKTRIKKTVERDPKTHQITSVIEETTEVE